MGKRKHKRETAQLYAQIAHTAAESNQVVETSASAATTTSHDAPPSDDVLADSKELSGLVSGNQKRELTKMKKFRFQLLHQWILAHQEPCRVADVAGGKGMLAYLLQNSGWSATVIDPIDQALPTKYKNIETNKRVRIAETERVPRLNRIFDPSMAKHFDLLVAMHAHGCNIQLIDAAAEFGRNVIILPCCVIGEPMVPPPGVHWIQWVVEYAISKGFHVEPFRLNFKGQNIGIYGRHIPLSPNL